MRNCINCGSQYQVSREGLCYWCNDFERRFGRPRPISEKRMEKLGRRPKPHQFTMPVNKVLVWQRYRDEYISSAPMIEGRDYFMDDLLKKYAGKRVDPVPMPAEAPLFLMYTSGTTGHQKGVIYTHKNLMASIMNFTTMLTVSSDDNTLHTSPFSHVAPIWPFLLHIYYGGSNVIIKNLNPVHLRTPVERNQLP